jgi:hypothetical protein
MAAKTQTPQAAFTNPTMDHPSDAIITLCPRCAKEGEVRGLDMDDITNLSTGVAAELKKVNGGKQFAIVRMCANCRYRMGANNKPMTDAQKEARKRYNKNRQAKINDALKYVANLSDEDRQAFQAKYLAEQAEAISHGHDGN